MINASTLDFLRLLPENNTKEWMESHRHLYESAKMDVLQLLGKLLAQIQTVDEAQRGSLLQPKDCLFALNRDTRFSADKSPYKTAFSAWISVGGKKSPEAGYYLYIQPGSSYLALGIFSPETAVQTRIRQEIDHRSQEFLKLVNEPRFVQEWGLAYSDETLKRVPKGYEESHPASEYLRFKSWLVRRDLPDSLLTQEHWLEEMSPALESAQAWLRFLNDAIRVEG